MDRERQSVSLYFSEEVLDEKDLMVDLLLDIDCNMSRLLTVLMSEVIKAAMKVKDRGLNYRNYEWRITVKRKKGV